VSCTEYDYSNLRGHDVYLQPDNDMVADLLFVIDNSASMAEEQALLGASFQAFVEAIEGTSADLQVGITTTDVDSDEAGHLTSSLMNQDTADLASVFLEAAAVGTNGSRYEKGFEAALLATLPSVNPDLLREGAMLHVIFVSDEDDQSNVSVDDALVALETRADNVFAHAIVGDLPGGCTSGSSAADAGERYAELAEQTAGRRDSICNDSHEEILQRIGLDAAGLADTFNLSAVPVEDSLEVWVDAVQIFERETDGWLYDVGENAVVFSGRAVPRAGMEVVIDYELWADSQAETE
jgi:hypothetical protein